MSLFNADQRDYMASLASMPAETKCWCGWNEKGRCYNCNRDGIAHLNCADKMRLQCPECLSTPGLPHLPVGHTLLCSRYQPAETRGKESAT